MSFIHNSTISTINARMRSRAAIDANMRDRVRVLDMCARTHKATAGERGLTATLDIVAVGAQGIILQASPLVVLFVVSLTA